MYKLSNNSVWVLVHKTPKLTFDLITTNFSGFSMKWILLCFRLIGYDNIYGDRAEYNPSVSTDSYNYLTNKHEEKTETSNRKGKPVISKKQSAIKNKYIRCLESITHDFQPE